MKKILIVDDEPDIIEFLKYNLEKSGYITQSAINGEDCMKKLEKFTPQVIILDVMMPNMNGVETCEKIREKSKFLDIIIVFLSARNEDFTQIACYNSGGDYFISKPIQPKLLLTKIEVIFNRLNIAKKTLNGIQIDEEKHVVLNEGKVIKLTKKQFQLLKLLYSKPERVFTREEIIHSIWGNNYYVSERNIDVQIRQLRKQIGEKKIETIKGVGYKFPIE